MEKLCEDLWLDCPLGGALVQDTPGSQACRVSSFSPGCQQGQVGTAVVALEIQCGLLGGHRCFQREDGSGGAKGLEQGCSQSQGVTETGLTLLRSHLENAATDQQHRGLREMSRC